MQFVDLTAQYRAYQKEIDAAVAAVLTTSQFIGGPAINELEMKLAAMVGVDHGIACASGTDALLLSLMALGIGPGDEVVTTPFTFIATAETIALVGATPVFIDIEPDTYMINPDLLEDVVSPRTKAIIAVDIFGFSADYGRLQAFADCHGVALIEDAAQSLGGRWQDKQCGSFGTLAATSFFPAKPLGCYGDGGMIFTRDAECAERLSMLRNHGQNQRYHHQLLGVNSRLDTLQAAVLLAKLPFFETEIDRRRTIAARYSSAFAASFQVPVEKIGSRSVYAQYSLRSKFRDRILETLRKAGIPTAIHYPIPLHRQEVFAHLGYQEGCLPIAEQVCKEIFSLPVHPFLSDAEVEMIIDCSIGALKS
ncbi:MAG: DegT/DnrJ/EryC1/StrS family aminotransferase [Deltaproteobacteria bacterium]|nr:DegT/DnrJ/EryC1/StrS family aminotransferase [Candidatus Anaeroferrophillus wilburensis]MBN2889873.1 DegT/DnrJ/EryC1/StrS family aminotransferase [Deltaproteobacteria bacterium]